MISVNKYKTIDFTGFFEGQFLSGFYLKFEDRNKEYFSFEFSMYNKFVFRIK